MDSDEIFDEQMELYVVKSGFGEVFPAIAEDRQWNSIPCIDGKYRRMLGTIFPWTIAIVLLEK